VPEEPDEDEFDEDDADDETEAEHPPPVLHAVETPLSNVGAVDEETAIPADTVEKFLGAKLKDFLEPLLRAEATQRPCPSGIAQDVFPQDALMSA